MLNLPGAPESAIKYLIQAAEFCRPMKIANIINVHIVTIDKYFAFFGIPAPSRKRSTWSPKRGWLTTQWYIFVELRKKHPAARIIKIVVGRPGTIMPTIPTPVRTIPMDSQTILSAGMFPAPRIFLFFINERPKNDQI